MNEDASLFARLGGEAAVEAAVVRFYEKVMDDPTVARFFDELDMDAQIQKQIAFMTMAFGGPNKYTGRNLRTAHAKLVKNGLGDAHFDAIARHLKATLEELEVGDDVIAEVLSLVDGTRDDVLGR
jgi:hemoglobin